MAFPWAFRRRMEDSSSTTESLRPALLARFLSRLKIPASLPQPPRERDPDFLTRREHGQGTNYPLLRRSPTPPVSAFPCSASTPLRRLRGAHSIVAVIGFLRHPARPHCEADSAGFRLLLARCRTLCPNG